MSLDLGKFRVGLLAKFRNMGGEQKTEMTFLQHLEELRWVLVRSIIAMVVMAIVAFLLKDILFNYILLAPREPWFISNRLLCELAVKLNTPSLCINQSPVPLQNITMGGQFNMHMWASLVFGFILAFPYIFLQVWRFLSPALKPSEQKYARGAVFFSSLLFFIGVLFGFFVLLPFSIDFLTTYSVSDQIQNQINFVSYISNITMVTLACGIVFELPVVVYFLSAIGVLTPKAMRKYWRHSLIGILVVSAIITPPDIISQVFIAMPLMALYWGSIFISAVVVRKMNKSKK